MKTLREMMDQIDEISRRDFLKGAGAAAVVGATSGGAQADRGWTKDPITDQWDAWMTSNTFSGATIHWEESRKIVSLSLAQPTNPSLNNMKSGRLHYPKITSPKFSMKFQASSIPPFTTTGQVYTFPMRDFGNYTGYGIILLSGRSVDSWRDSFINSEEVYVRLEIDGVPQTITFHDNPELIRIRRQAAQSQEQVKEASPEAIAKIEKLSQQ